jgi:O-succinylbenzoic acid--CoA ligase
MPAWLQRAAQRRPDAVAIETPEGSLTYAELLERALATDPEPYITHPPGLDFAVALHACLLRDVGAVPLDPRLTDAERAARITGIKGPGPLIPGLVLVVFTSGTTAEPKPVAIAARHVEANALGSAVALGLDPQERWLCPLPLSHVGGLMILLRSVIYATTAVVTPFDAQAVAARLIAGDVTLVSLVPTMLSRLLDIGLTQPPRLRTVLLGGAPASPALLERAAAAGVPVTPTYGMTEACSQITTAIPGEQTAGWPLPGVTVEIADDGEILVTGPIVTGEGTLRTGDLGRIDERGRLEVIGRKADTIVTGGENVAPAEVEAVLAAHPDVVDAAVVGRPDPEWGEALVALIVGAADPDDLRDFCRERLARFKVPKAFETVQELPRTASGKLIRTALA